LVVRHKVDELSIAAIDGAEHALTELSGVFDDRFEHWLRIEGRAADDVKHFRSGGLLLERFAQLVEQAGVLDGDHGLGGEICHQLNLLVREGANFLTKDDDGSNQVIVLKHRHSDVGSNATKLDGVDDRWIALGIRSCRCNVGGLDGLFGSDQLAQGATRGGTDRTASARLGKCQRHIVAGDDAQCPAFMEIEVAELGLADAHRIRQHGLEHRLEFA
jgi:hypothetical protein